MTTHGLMIELEELIDKHSLHSLLIALINVCDGKAAHLATNWQDHESAKAWKKVMVALDVAESKAYDGNL